MTTLGRRHSPETRAKIKEALQFGKAAQRARAKEAAKMLADIRNKKFLRLLREEAERSNSSE
jgi:tRNA nucleotidyltransferase/poly(A) polymerase